MKNHTKIILGTVQLGLNYGINNSIGKPVAKQAIKILDIARDQGIRLLDTAEAYGDAISIIADYHKSSKQIFEIISKFKFSAGMNLLKSASNAIARLKTESLFAYLLHDADKISANETADQFNELKQKQIVKYNGVSIYTNEQFEEAINAPYIDLIQLPYNVLDNDNLRGELIKKAKKNGKIIHTRSVFLQGLIFMKASQLPQKLRPLNNYLEEIDTLCKKYKINQTSLALNYVLKNKSVDGVLIGVDSPEQLYSNIAVLNDQLPAELFDSVDALHVKEISLLNPANWN